MLPEYELNWIKIMDFLLVSNCLAFPIFYYPYFSVMLTVIPYHFGGNLSQIV